MLKFSFNDTMKLCMAVVLLVGCASANAAVTRDYDAIATKAARFFHYREWTNAAAMYELMIEDSAKVCDTYAHAIVTAGMRNLPDYEMSLLERAQSQLIPLDSGFQGVRRVSFSIGQSSLYENFLLLVKERQPWLTRSIEKQLLSYYVFRCNAPEIIRYSRIMLSGAPDNVAFMNNLAYGYMLSGDEEQGIATYKEILKLHPDNYDALLVLGNYYRQKGDMAQSREYLERALTIKATPYVSELLGIGVDKH